jgi:serine/threonine protein phosphatase 1
VVALKGKREDGWPRVVCGHTATRHLPPEVSSRAVELDDDVWAGADVCTIDAGAGMGGFLTAIELPAAKVYESRRR